ncbi:reverse transcriptase domain-containing protein [Tanacetum coccineum]
MRERHLKGKFLRATVKRHSNHRLNSLFSIKECMSCGALYTRNCGCSKGSLEDKILVPVPDSSQQPPQNCATCGNPVDGLNCRSCAFVRKCLNEGWYTIHDENKILNTSKSSNHNTNVMISFVNNVLASLVGTCSSGYNCPPKAPIISNPEQCNQTINELPQTLPSVHPTCNYEDENSFTYDSKPNSFNDSPSVLTHPPQLQFETYYIEPNQEGLTSVVISDNSNNPLLELPEFESFHFDLDPSFPRPLLEPPDAEISLIIETDAPVIDNFDELNEDECFDPGGVKTPFMTPASPLRAGGFSSMELSMIDPNSEKTLVKPEVFEPKVHDPDTGGSPLWVSNPGHLAARLGCAEMKVATWDDLDFKLIILRYGYCKNLKKTVKTGQTRTRERKSTQRAGRMLSKVNSGVGIFLDKMPRECLRIIESKSKVRNSRNKAVIVKVSSNSSTPGISPDVAALTTEVSELKNIMKTMLIDKQKAQAPAPVKAVEHSCVTCGGAHSYRNCPATNGNVNRDNIQQYVSQAAAANFNQGNTNHRPPNRVSNQMVPPGFALMQNNGQNRFNQNQNQRNNFNQGNNFQGFQNQVNHMPNQGFQNQPFQAHNNQFQQGIPSEITSYMKANESIVRNMQGQINEIRSALTKQEENLRRNLNDDMRSILGNFFQNHVSTSGTLSSNTVPNPKGEMKAITTRSGVSYEGPSIPTNRSPKKTLLKTTPILKSDILKNLPKPNIPYPSRCDDQKSRDKASTQMEKIFQIFQDLRFDISFTDALLLIPRFALTIKSLLMNKEKLLELAKIPLNENCSVMLLKKLPENLGDPDKFLIPCNFLGMDVCHALAVLGASINLMPLSIWKKLSLPDLTPTRMTLELVDRSITRSKGLAEDIFVKVGNFYFPTDFVVVDFESDPRVSLILGRSFLRTSRALIDVYQGELVLRDENKQITFHVNDTQKHKTSQLKWLMTHARIVLKGLPTNPLKFAPSEDVNNEKEKQEVKTLAEPTV